MPVTPMSGEWQGVIKVELIELVRNRKDCREKISYIGMVRKRNVLKKMVRKR